MKMKIKGGRINRNGNKEKKKQRQVKRDNWRKTRRVTMAVIITQWQQDYKSNLFKNRVKLLIYTSMYIYSFKQRC